MKRKRTLETEETEESLKVKKRKPRTKRTEYSTLEADVSNANEELESVEDKIETVARNSKRKGKKVQILREEEDISSDNPSVQPEPSSSTENIPKKKRRSKSDFNQNGDVGKNTKPNKEVLKNSKRSANSKGKKKNGLQNREASESPSDFQPLGQLLKKEESLKNDNLQAEPKKSSIEDEALEPAKKRRGRKKKIPSELKIIKSENRTTLRETTVGGGIQTQENAEELNEEPFKPDFPQKKPKKKVRIDETESLKIKKELADSELHFSVRELPAKIIKSKLNKNLTEEVKVSPLTVQSSKRKATRHVKPEKLLAAENSEDFEMVIKTEELKIEDDDIENEINNESSNSEDSDLEVYYINKNAEKEAKMKMLAPKKPSILMPKEDQLILVQRVQNVIPEGDTKSYKFRVQKLEWEEVAFKNYSIEDCQKVWGQLLKKVRHYRLLVEITHDIKNVIEFNDMQAAKSRSTKSSSKKHPDMPKRPLTSYFLYYIRKRDKIAKEKSDLDTLELNKYISEKYQNLPLYKKQKYENLAAKNREEYKRQMEEFYAKHPEMRKVIIKKTIKRAQKQKPPKRPDNPYRLFMQSELNREEIAEEDKAEFKEVCREKWRQMSETKKLGWINLAEEQLQKYEDELKEYMALHPEYTPKPQPKPFLSREEIKLKDKLAGKPKKPPSTAYGLFISLTLQGNDIGTVPPKERWIFTSTKWKAMTEEERDQYKQLLTQVHDQYEKDFKVYLESLPEDKREEEILRNMPKKRKNAAAEKSSTSTKTAKASTSRSQQPRRKSVALASNTKPKPQNPIPPPRSAFKYFTDKYQGENPKEAWKNLDPAERENYEKELNALKDKYIKEFEIFLKSLSKDELAVFCANRSKQKDYSSSDETGSESENNDESSDDSSDSSDSDDEFEEN